MSSPPPLARSRSIGRLLIAALLALTFTAGCGYSIRPPFEPTVRTVYVPVFRSVTFRREVNLQLTKLVQQEIERRTPFKVVGSPDGADTTLDGVISTAEKNIVTENPNNLPRELLAAMTVRVRWIDNRTGFANERQVDAPIVNVNENSHFYPELGETVQLGYYKVMEQLARDIVNMMEEPW